MLMLKGFQTKKYNSYSSNNLTPLDMYNGLLPIFIVSNKKEEPIQIQSVKGSCVLHYEFM